jgi:hypothetical protein
MGLPVAMADDQTARLKAVAQQQEAILLLRMIWVVDQAGALVQKNGLYFLEGDAGFTRLDRALRRSQANSILPTALF